MNENRVLFELTSGGGGIEGIVLVVLKLNIW